MEVAYCSWILATCAVKNVQSYLQTEQQPVNYNSTFLQENWPAFVFLPELVSGSQVVGFSVLHLWSGTGGRWLCPRPLLHHHPVELEVLLDKTHILMKICQVIFDHHWLFWHIRADVSAHESQLMPFSVFWFFFYVKWSKSLSFLNGLNPEWNHQEKAKTQWFRGTLWI